MTERYPTIEKPYILNTLHKIDIPNMPPYSMDSDSYDYDASSSSSSQPPTIPHQPLHHNLHKATSNVETKHDLIQLAAVELESMREASTPKNNNSNNNERRPPQKQDSSGSLNSTNSNNSQNSHSSSSSQEEVERAFPPACLHLLHTLSTNTKCHDCDAPHPSWASVSYGIMLCLQCSGKHRSLGVNVSYVKSVNLDSWKRTEILCMLEGGNGQLSQFFDRHELGNGMQQQSLSPTHAASGGRGGTCSTGILDRYKTKAASFYRQHLKSHAKMVAAKGGLYKGREASRKGSSSSSSGGKKKSKRKKKSSGEHEKKKLEPVVEKDIDSSCGSTRTR